MIASPVAALAVAASDSMLGSAILFANTAFSWLTSCRLAPVTTIDNGTSSLSPDLTLSLENVAI